LVIPASSGRSKRGFSVIGWQTDGRKNRKTGENIDEKSIFYPVIRIYLGFFSFLKISNSHVPTHSVIWQSKGAKIC
jgi:hypothetical protein